MTNKQRRSAVDRLADSMGVCEGDLLKTSFLHRSQLKRLIGAEALSIVDRYNIIEYYLSRDPHQRYYLWADVYLIEGMDADELESHGAEKMRAAMQAIVAEVQP